MKTWNTPVIEELNVVMTMSGRTEEYGEENIPGGSANSIKPRYAVTPVNPVPNDPPAAS